MLHEKSCGAIVYRKSHGNIEILLIKHVNSGHWSFPKGHVEGDETEVETAEREIREETGIEVNIDPTFRETVSYSPKRDTQKVVVYFLAKAKTFNFVPQEEEIAEIRWVDIVHAGHVLTYENDKTIVTKARAAIKETGQGKSGGMWIPYAAGFVFLSNIPRCSLYAMWNFRQKH